MKFPKELSLLLIALWVANILLNLIKVSLPFLAEVTVLLTLFGVLYGAYSKTKFDMGWEAIGGIALVGILIALGFTASSSFLPSLGLINGFSLAFLWTGSIPSLVGLLVAIFLTAGIGALKKIMKR